MLGRHADMPKEVAHWVQIEFKAIETFRKHNSNAVTSWLAASTGSFHGIGFQLTVRKAGTVYHWRARIATASKPGR
jgi:hypothetical protein